jgi:hypothetical protein
VEPSSEVGAKPRSRAVILRLARTEMVGLTAPLEDLHVAVAEVEGELASGVVALLGSAPCLPLSLRQRQLRLHHLMVLPLSLHQPLPLSAWALRLTVSRPPCPTRRCITPSRLSRPWSGYVCVLYVCVHGCSANVFASACVCVCVGVHVYVSGHVCMCFNGWFVFAGVLRMCHLLDGCRSGGPCLDVPLLLARVAPGLCEHMADQQRGNSSRCDAWARRLRSFLGTSCRLLPPSPLSHQALGVKGCGVVWLPCAGQPFRCPACQYTYTEVPVYRCFCGRVRNPDENGFLVPHSCGGTCNRARARFATSLAFCC